MCGVLTVGCDSGVICVYDSLHKTLSNDLAHLIASMVYSPLSELKIVMMDVEKQSNGSDCGVLAIAYVFNICSSVDPCVVRFDHSKIRQHLATCLENCQVSHFPVLGERNSVARKLELHCSCHMPEEEGIRWLCVIPVTSGITVTAWTFPVRCVVSLRFTGSVKDV